MLDRTDYESWSQRFRCSVEEGNGLQILQSIDQGLFELGTIRDALGTTPEGGVLLGLERPRTYEDLSDTEKKRYDADVRATNITNNQLRTSSNTRNQATIQDGRVVVQKLKGGQESEFRGQGKPVKCYNCNGVGNIARNCTQPKRLQNSDYFKDKMLLMQAHEHADECDAFDSDVDDEPTAQSIFMANLSLVG
ncbi:integrase, catalytic region, zinc finger, CCHC-type containing protein [Tanacetum coccineum]